MSSEKGKLLGGILIISGTAIGAGMLAMPISTGLIGFSFASMTMILSFLYMLICMFVMLEANLYCKNNNSSIISMAKEFLGKTGAIIAWIAFLLLLYSASAAYISGGGSLLLSIDFISKHLDHDFACILFALIFGCIGFLGVKYIDLLNRFFMFGLVISYLALIFVVSPKVEIENLSTSNPKYILATIPILILSFTSHLVLPSLRQYFNNDVKKLKKVIILGSAIPLLVYLVWELLLLGVIPENSLIEIAQSTDPLPKLNSILHAKNISGMASSNATFSFFALVTSYLGVILSLDDFIADGLNIKQDVKGKILTVILSFTPPIIFAITYPEGFMKALSYAGVFVAILFCIMPVCIIWNARYIKQLPKTSYYFPGGKIGLVLIALIAIGIIILQILSTNGMLPKV